MNRRGFLTAGSALALTGGTFMAFFGRDSAAKSEEKFEFTLTDAEWRAKLSPAAFAVLRQESTERAGSSPLDQEKRAGVFHCAGCDLPLFDMKTKFNSGTGWPSFYEPLTNAVATREDKSFFSTRTEVHCRRCGGHLGHVFPDGPRPTGLRYCMNGVSLRFEPTA